MGSGAGVLCTRVRLEEKRMIAALEQVGVEVEPFPRSDAPLPIGPPPLEAGSGEDLEHPRIVIDRLADRSAAACLFRLAPLAAHHWAGAATTLDRLAVARLLTEAGLPRPETAVVMSEVCGLNAVDLFDGHGTLLPLRAGARELPLHDRESAEAMLEHRGVLGEAPRLDLADARGIAGVGARAGRDVDGGGSHAGGNFGVPRWEACAIGGRSACSGAR